MRLSLAVLGLLGATTALGCDGSNDSDDQAGAAPAHASAEPEAHDRYGAPRVDPNGPQPSEPEATDDDVAPTPAAPREPPTPPPHVNELFRTPGGDPASQPSPEPLPPVVPTPVQTTKPAPPPPPPPPPPRPRPWGGSDPCPPCGMG